MSRESVESIRRLAEGFFACRSEEDFEGWLARAAERWDPEIEFDTSDFPFPDVRGISRGRQAVERWWHDWLAAWGTLEADYELRDAGDSVVLLLSQRMRGRSSGVEVPVWRYAAVITLRDGLITRWRIYASQDEALAAAGLPRRSPTGEP